MLLLMTNLVFASCPEPWEEPSEKSTGMSSRTSSRNNTPPPLYTLDEENVKDLEFYFLRRIKNEPKENTSSAIEWANMLAKYQPELKVKCLTALFGRIALGYPESSPFITDSFNRPHAASSTGKQGPTLEAFLVSILSYVPVEYQAFYWNFVWQIFPTEMQELYQSVLELIFPNSTPSNASSNGNSDINSESDCSEGEIEIIKNDTPINDWINGVKKAKSSKQKSIEEMRAKHPRPWRP